MKKITVPVAEIIMHRSLRKKSINHTARVERKQRLRESKLRLTLFMEDSIFHLLIGKIVEY